MKKRGRACVECHRLKIKCEGSPLEGVACERCSRHNLKCVAAAPRLQRDRISELEAQVEELKNELRNQSHGSSSTTSSLSPGRSLENHSYPDAILLFLDARIPPPRQQDLLRCFAQQAGAAWPLIRLPLQLTAIRAKSPVLLLSVVACSVTQEAQGSDLEVHDELVRETMRVLGDEVMGRGQRCLELVQALLVAAFWNKSTRKGQQGSCYQLIQLAADMAIDIGIAGHSLQPSPAAYFSQHEDPTSLEARRTWLACFVALSTSSVSMRRPHTIPWNAHHHDCLVYLESNGDSSDLLLCQIVRITQLIQEISNQLCLFQLGTFIDGNDHNTYTAIDILKNKLDIWAAQIPPSLASSQTLRVWWHVAMIHLYEVVLHTPTNKPAFVPPFIPGRIPVKDFPNPAHVIPPLAEALEAIIENCRGVIDTAADMDPALVLSLPSFCFAPTVLYALYVLVTALVTTTDPANTYSKCVAKDRFRIEECGMRLRNLTARMKLLDPTMSCWTTRMFDATSWLEEWFNDYTAIVRRYECNVAY